MNLDELLASPDYQSAAPDDRMRHIDDWALQAKTDYPDEAEGLDETIPKLRAKEYARAAIPTLQLDPETATRYGDLYKLAQRPSTHEREDWNRYDEEYTAKDTALAQMAPEERMKFSQFEEVMNRAGNHYRTGEEAKQGWRQSALDYGNGVKIPISTRTLHDRKQAEVTYPDGTKETFEYAPDEQPPDANRLRKFMVENRKEHLAGWEPDMNYFPVSPWLANATARNVAAHAGNAAVDMTAGGLQFGEDIAKTVGAGDRDTFLENQGANIIPMFVKLEKGPDGQERWVKRDKNEFLSKMSDEEWKKLSDRATQVATGKAPADKEFLKALVSNEAISSQIPKSYEGMGGQGAEWLFHGDEGERIKPHPLAEQSLEEQKRLKAQFARQGLKERQETREGLRPFNVDPENLLTNQEDKLTVDGGWFGAQALDLLGDYAFNAPTVGQAAGSSLPGFVAAVAGGPAAALPFAGIMGMSEGNQAYEDVLQRNLDAGIDPETAKGTAMQAGLAYAAVATALEQAGSIFEAGVFKGTLGQTRWGRFLLGLVPEPTEEASQSLAQDLISNANVPDAQKKAALQILKDATEAGAGALSFGVLPGVGGALRANPQPTAEGTETAPAAPAHDFSAFTYQPEETPTGAPHAQPAAAVPHLSEIDQRITEEKASRDKMRQQITDPAQLERYEQDYDKRIGDLEAQKADLEAADPQTEEEAAASAVITDTDVPVEAKEIVAEAAQMAAEVAPSVTPAPVSVTPEAPIVTSPPLQQTPAATQNAQRPITTGAPAQAQLAPFTPTQAPNAPEPAATVQAPSVEEAQAPTPEKAPEAQAPANPLQNLPVGEVRSRMREAGVSEAQIDEATPAGVVNADLAAQRISEAKAREGPRQATITIPQGTKAELLTPEQKPKPRRFARLVNKVRQALKSKELKKHPAVENDIITRTHSEYSGQGISPPRLEGGKLAPEYQNSDWDWLESIIGDKEAWDALNDFLFHGGTPNVKGIDEAASHFDMTPDEYGQAVLAALNERMRIAKEMAEGKTTTAEEVGTEQSQAEAFAKATAEGAVPITTWDVQPGDTLDVEGEPVEVVGVIQSFDEDTNKAKVQTAEGEKTMRLDRGSPGDVILKDGTRFGRQTLPEGETIWVERHGRAAEAEEGMGKEPAEETPGKESEPVAAAPEKEGETPEIRKRFQSIDSVADELDRSARTSGITYQALAKEVAALAGDRLQELADALGYAKANALDIAQQLILDAKRAMGQKRAEQAPTKDTETDTEEEAEQKATTTEDRKLTAQDRLEKREEDKDEAPEGTRPKDYKENPSQQSSREQHNKEVLRRHGIPDEGEHAAGPIMRKALESIAADKSLPQFVRDMARMLAKKSFAGVTLRIISDPSVKSAGRYIKEERVIEVNLPYMGLGRTNAVASLMHEGLHHVTTRTLNDPETAEEKEAVQWFEDTLAKTKKWLEKNAPETAKKFAYQLGSMDEFMTAIFTNGQFVNEALSVVPENFRDKGLRSILEAIWNKIVEFVTGTPTKKGSALETAVMRANAVVLAANLEREAAEELRGLPAHATAQDLMDGRAPSLMTWGRQVSGQLKNLAEFTAKGVRTFGQAFTRIAESLWRAVQALIIGTIALHTAANSTQTGGAATEGRYSLKPVREELAPITGTQTKIPLASNATPIDAEVIKGIGVVTPAASTDKRDDLIPLTNIPNLEETPTTKRTDTEKLSLWVRANRDNAGMPYLIADKKKGTITLFDGSGKQVSTHPALFGKNKGDFISEEQEEPRVTPAGRFEASAPEPYTGDSGDVSPEMGLSIDFLERENSVLSIHRLYLGSPSEQRPQRLASKSGKDNRISYGCINLEAEVMDGEVIPLFEDGGVIYVLPETKPGKAVFPDALLNPAEDSIPERPHTKVAFTLWQELNAMDAQLQSDALDEAWTSHYVARKANGESDAEIREAWEKELADPESPSVFQGVVEVKRQRKGRDYTPEDVRRDAKPSEPNQGDDALQNPADITPEQDAAYLAAVQSGDMETAQRMVTQAANLGDRKFEIQLSKDDVEEVVHKLGVLRDEPELREGFGVTEEQVTTLIRSIPANGGTWTIPHDALGILKSELDNHADVLYDIAHDAKGENKRAEARKIEKQADKFKSFARTLPDTSVVVSNDDDFVTPLSQRFNPQSSSILYNPAEDIPPSQIVPSSLESPTAEPAPAAEVPNNFGTKERRETFEKYKDEAPEHMKHFVQMMGTTTGFQRLTQSIAPMIRMARAKLGSFRPDQAPDINEENTRKAKTIAKALLSRETFARDYIKEWRTWWSPRNAQNQPTHLGDAAAAVMQMELFDYAVRLAETGDFSLALMVAPYANDVIIGDYMTMSGAARALGVRSYAVRNGKFWQALQLLSKGRAMAAAITAGGDENLEKLTEAFFSGEFDAEALAAVMADAQNTVEGKEVLADIASAKEADAQAQEDEDDWPLAMEALDERERQLLARLIDRLDTLESKLRRIAELEDQEGTANPAEEGNILFNKPDTTTDKAALKKEADALKAEIADILRQLSETDTSSLSAEARKKILRPYKKSRKLIGAGDQARKHLDSLETKAKRTPKDKPPWRKDYEEAIRSKEEPDAEEFTGKMRRHGIGQATAERLLESVTARRTKRTQNKRARQKASEAPLVFQEWVAGQSQAGVPDFQELVLSHVTEAGFDAKKFAQSLANKFENVDPAFIQEVTDRIAAALKDQKEETESEPDYDARAKRMVGAAVAKDAMPELAKKIDPMTDAIKRRMKGDITADQLREELAALDIEDQTVFAVSRKVEEDMAKRAAERAKKKAEAAAKKLAAEQNAPNQVAQSIIDKLDEEQTEWVAPDKDKNAIRELARQAGRDVGRGQRKDWFAEYAAKFEALGVKPEVAKILTERLWNENQRRQATKESNARQAATKGLRFINSIVRSILSAPRDLQANPEWRHDIAVKAFQDSGMTQERAEKAALWIEGRIEKHLAEARIKAVEKAAKGIKKAKFGLDLLREAIRAGVFDPDDPNAKALAKKAGFKELTPEQFRRMAELDSLIASSGPTMMGRYMSELFTLLNQAQMPKSAYQIVGQSWINSALSSLGTMGLNWIQAISGPLLRQGVEMSRLMGEVVTGKVKRSQALTQFGNLWQAFFDAHLNFFRDVIFSAKHDSYRVKMLEEYDEAHRMAREFQDAINELKDPKRPAHKKLASGVKLIWTSTDFVRRAMSMADNAWGSVLQSQVLQTEAMRSMIQKGGLTPEQAWLRVQAAQDRGAQKMKEFAKENPDQKGAAILVGRDAFEAELAREAELATGKIGEAQTLTTTAAKESTMLLGNRRGETSPMWDFFNQFSEWAKSGSRLAEEKFGTLVAKMVFGFISVNANILNYTANYSPWGFLRLAQRKWGPNDKKGDAYYSETMATDAQAKTRLAEAVIGTTVMMLGTILRLKDDDDDDWIAITGAGPQDKADKQTWQAKGHKPHHLEVRNNKGEVITSVPTTRGGLQHMAIPMMMLGAIDDTLIKKGTPAQRASNAFNLGEYANSLGPAFGSAAGFFGVKNFLGTREPTTLNEKGVAGNLAYAAAPSIPFSGLIKSTAKLFTGPQDTSSTVGAAITAQIPIVNLWNEPSLNFLGDPLGVHTGSNWQTAVDRAEFSSLLPVFVGGGKKGPRSDVYSWIGQTGLAPSVPNRAAVVKSNPEMTPKQWREYVERRGEIIVDALRPKMDRLSSLPRAEADDEMINLSSKATLQTKKELGLK